MPLSRTASGVHGFLGRDPGVVARASLDPRLISVTPLACKLALVEWILKNNTDPNRSFVIGYEGAFRTREKTDGDSTNGIYVLTATYMDRGAKDAPQSSKESQHTVVLRAAR